MMQSLMPIAIWSAIVSGLALTLIWIGYPLAMHLLASLRRADTNASPIEHSKPRVSVVLATRDAAGVVRSRVNDLLSSRADRLEVVVAIDCLTDLNAEELQQISDDARVRVVAGDAPAGKAGALNAGVRAATGDILVFADSRQAFERDTIPALIDALRDGRYGAVSGALDLGGSSTPIHVYWAIEKWLRRSEAIIHSSIGVTGAVYAMRRDLWLPIPPGTLLDDVFVPMSLVLRGYRVGFEPRARARDLRTFDADAESSRKARTLTGILQLHRLLPDILSPRKNPVFAQYVAHKLLRFTTPVWLGLLMFAGTIGFLGMLIRWPQQTFLTVLFVLVACVAFAPLRNTFLLVLRWIVAMQRAIVSAVINNARGRFEVWTRSK